MSGDGADANGIVGQLETVCSDNSGGPRIVFSIPPTPPAAPKSRSSILPQKEGALPFPATHQYAENPSDDRPTSV